jgi:translation initiation factor IF-1
LVRARQSVAKTNMLNSEKAIQLEGMITAVLPRTMFRVALANDHLVLAHVSGEMASGSYALQSGTG